MNSEDVILFTRKGCHLCDDALALLNDHGVEPKLVDIDEDPDLQSRYGAWVPVVRIDGTDRFRGRIAPRLLKRLLAARRGR